MSLPYVSSSSCIFFALVLESNISPRNSGSVYWRTELENRIWVLDVLVAPGLLSLLGMLS